MLCSLQLQCRQRSQANGDLGFTWASCSCSCRCQRCRRNLLLVALVGVVPWLVAAVADDRATPRGHPATCHTPPPAEARAWVGEGTTSIGTATKATKLGACWEGAAGSCAILIIAEEACSGRRWAKARAVGTTTGSKGERWLGPVVSARPVATVERVHLVKKKTHQSCTTPAGNQRGQAGTRDKYVQVSVDVT